MWFLGEQEEGWLVMGQWHMKTEVVRMTATALKPVTRSYLSCLFSHTFISTISFHPPSNSTQNRLQSSHFTDGKAECMRMK